jgi:hypothetical protein
MLNFDALKVDLVRLAEQAGSQMKFASGEWRGNCPIHRGDNKSAFVIYDDDGKQKWKCWSNDCGSGDALDLVMKLNNCDLKTAYRMLGGEANPDPVAVRQAATERAERAERQLQATIEKAQVALKDLREACAWESYHQQLEECEEAQGLWAQRGIPEVWQELWHLGYCKNFRATTSEGTLITPTLTIPIFGPAWELQNIRHRLLNPINPKDKYRPDRPGLPARPFMCDPDMGMNANNVLVVEGEIKSMVTYITLDSLKWQVLGIPGKSWFSHIVDQLKGKRVIICFDPDAEAEAAEAANATGGKVVRLQVKIDDIINAGGLDQAGLRNLIKGATKP